MIKPPRIPFRRPSFEPSDVATVAGLGLLWPCLLPYVYRDIVNNLLTLPSHQDCALLVGILLPVVIVAILLFRALSGSANPTAGAPSPQQAWYAGAIGTAGNALLLAIPGLPAETAPLATALACTLAGLFVAFATVAWGPASAAGRPERTGLRVALSFALGYALIIPFFCVGEPLAFLFCLFPIASMALLVLRSATAHAIVGQCGEAHPPAETASDARHRVPIASASSMLIASALLVWFNIVFVKLLSAEAGFEARASQVVTAVLSIAVILLVTAATSRAPEPHTATAVAFLLLIVAYLVVLLVVVVLHDVAYTLSRRLWTVAGTSFKAFAWLAACRAAADNPPRAHGLFVLYGILLVGVPFAISLSPAAAGAGIVAALGGTRAVVTMGEVVLFLIAAASVATVAVRLLRAGGATGGPSGPGCPVSTPDVSGPGAHGMAAGTERALRAAGLTPRELQIVELMRNGHGARAIGDRLGLSQRTVSNNTTAIYRKLGVHGRSELIAALDAFDDSVTSQVKDPVNRP